MFLRKDSDIDTDSNVKSKILELSGDTGVIFMRFIRMMKNL